MLGAEVKAENKASPTPAFRELGLTPAKKHQSRQCPDGSKGGERGRVSALWKEEGSQQQMGGYLRRQTAWSSHILVLHPLFGDPYPHIH